MGEKEMRYNKTLHLVATIEEIDGVLHVVSQPQFKESLKKGEYLPIGNRLVFPKKWGRKAGAKLLLDHTIADKEKILQQTIERLERLKECRSRVEEWDDFD